MLDNEHHGDADIEETQDFPLDNEHLGGVDIRESRTEPLRGSFSGKIKLIGQGDVRTLPYLYWWDQEQDSLLDSEHHGDADIEESQDFPLDSKHLGGVDIGESRLDPSRKT